MSVGGGPWYIQLEQKVDVVLQIQKGQLQDGHSSNYYHRHCNLTNNQCITST